jgi:hypothetical protein
MSGNEMNLRRGLQDCGCSDGVSKDEFLEKLSKRLSLNLKNGDNVTDVFETEEKECEQEVTNFTSNIAMEIKGNVDLVNTERLAALATSVVFAYNNANALSGETCDVLFRTVRAGSAIVDPLSIRLGEGNEVRRNLQSVTTDAPSSSMSPSTTPAPSQAPTTRGPDLFTLFVKMEGTCRGCPADANLFDQTNEDRKLQEAGWTARELLFDNDCFCAVGAVEGGPSIDDFTDAWKVQSEIVLGGLVFFEKLISVKEVKVFECQEELDELVTYLMVGFCGDSTLLTTQGLAAVKDIVLSAFNDLADQVCDTLLRYLLRVEISLLGATTEMPSQAPSISFMPSISAQPSQPPSIDPLKLV